jgi:hypothetical protein
MPSAAIPPGYNDLLEPPMVVILSILASYSKPYTVPVWRKRDGENVLVCAGTTSLR